MNVEPTAEELAAIREVVGWRESEVHPTADEWRLLDGFLRRVVATAAEPAHVGFGTDGPVQVVVRGVGTGGRDMEAARDLDEAIGRALAGEADALSGTFETVCESAWVDWSRGRRDVTLDGDFTAAELRRLAELLEPAVAGSPE